MARQSVFDMKVSKVYPLLLQKIRWLDKLVDDLAKGKPMEKVLP
ncbi:DUF2200 family protein [Lachnoclostridium sp. Marseille-P6806]|nr:DUF2200 family protein [Lachnoclostridium sp. Marseille-P6806]